MFEMFRGGKPDPLTLAVVDEYENNNRFDKIDKALKLRRERGKTLGYWLIKCGITDLSEEEYEYIKRH